MSRGGREARKVLQRPAKAAELAAPTEQLTNRQVFCRWMTWRTDNFRLVCIVLYQFEFVPAPGLGSDADFGFFSEHQVAVLQHFDVWDYSLYEA